MRKHSRKFIIISFAFTFIYLFFGMSFVLFIMEHRGKMTEVEALIISCIFVFTIKIPKIMSWLSDKYNW